MKFRTHFHDEIFANFMFLKQKKNRTVENIHPITISSIGGDINALREKDQIIDRLY